MGLLVGCSGCHAGDALLLSTICGVRMSCSLHDLSKVSSRSWGGIPVESGFASPPIAAVMQSAGVTNGLVKYLCLNNTAPDVQGPHPYHVASVALVIGQISTSLE